MFKPEGIILEFDKLSLIKFALIGLREKRFNGISLIKKLNTLDNLRSFIWSLRLRNKITSPHTTLGMLKSLLSPLHSIYLYILNIINICYILSNEIVNCNILFY